MLTLYTGPSHWEGQRGGKQKQTHSFTYPSGDDSQLKDVNANLTAERDQLRKELDMANNRPTGKSPTTKERTMTASIDALEREKTELYVLCMENSLGDSIYGLIETNLWMLGVPD